MALKSRPRERKPDLTVAELVQITPNKPDRPKPKRKIQGKRTKLSISEFVFQLLEANEKLEARHKKTNTALADIIIAEFPSRYQLHVTLRKGEKNGINAYRQKYNSGRLIPGRPVIYISFRYNEAGERVDYATGKRLLSVADQKKYLDKYKSKIMQAYEQFAKGNSDAKKKC